MMVAVGIDFGTSTSSVAVIENGSPVVIDDNSRRTIPSYISFYGTEILIGEEAKRQSVSNARNTIFDLKRLMGRKINEIHNRTNRWPFKIVAETDRLQIEVLFESVEKKFYPEYLASLILSELKKKAENHLGETVEDAVITVPACFNRAQRQAIRDAAAIAGLNILQILTDSFAAAMAFGNEMRNSSTILVYDLGGGSLDVTILNMDDGIFVVLSTACELHLGGEDFDHAIVQYLHT